MESNNDLARWIRESSDRAFTQINETYSQVEPNFWIIGVFGVIGFPLYYFVWQYLLPQAYENLPLRLVGAALCVPLLFVNRLTGPIKQHFRPVWYVIMTYNFPFFFTYMLIRNDFAAAWQLSLLCTVFIAFLIFDWLTVNIMYVVGSLLAWGVCYAQGAMPAHPEFYLQDLPIFAFLVIATMIFDRKTEMVRRERRRAAEAVRTGIAAEMIDPILGIATGATGLRSHLPMLLESYRVARSENLPVPPIDAALLQALEHVTERVQNEARHLSTIVDLLRPLRKDQLDQRTFGVLSMRECVENALARYPYRSVEEQRRVRFRRIEDFEFRGLKAPIENVIIGLVHEGLTSIQHIGRGDLTIWLKAGVKEHTVYLRDTSRAFDGPGPSSRAEGTNGTPEDIWGLANCEATLSVLGGTLTRVWKPGEPFEYHLKLPASVGVLRQVS
jgi:two-component system CAI-1 autoinducer sensor kinase/phosphatase CqsS